MKKNIFTALISIISISFCLSQDLIIKKTSEEIIAKVLEVTPTEIKYKKFDYQSGPIFTILKSEVLMIRYEKGPSDIFKESQTFVVVSTVPTGNMSLMGREDATSNYKGKQSGSGWVGATTVLFSPLVGLIPAIACGSTEPADDNLNYKDATLMRDLTYNKAYREEAHKIKKKKIWTSYGIGSGCWLLLLILL